MEWVDIEPDAPFSPVGTSSAVRDLPGRVNDYGIFRFFEDEDVLKIKTLAFGFTVDLKGDVADV